MPSNDELDREIDKEMGWAHRNASMKKRTDYWHAILSTARVSSPFFRIMRNILSAISKVVFFPIISPLGYSKRYTPHGDIVMVKRSFVWRIADGILTRLLLTPVILGIFLFSVVYFSTHPKSVQAFNTPDSYGLYYKRVSLFTIDNLRLAAWYVPPINAQEVTFDPEGTLVQKWPAVVVCHGLGGTHDEYLSLTRELHAAGFAVLLVDTRGQGDSDPAAVTYGLRERFDVLAGVKYLREIAYIDTAKVSIIGHDIAATAALEATSLDSSITAVVADGMWPKFEERAADIFAESSEQAGHGANLPTRWLAPLYSMAFEIAIRDQLGQVDPEFVVRGIHKQPVLFVAREGAEYATIQEVKALAGAHREVLLAPRGKKDWEKQICAFLTKANNWKGPMAHGKEQIEELMKNRVETK